MFKKISALGVVLTIVVLGVVAYSFLKPPKAASGPIEAIPVTVEQGASASPTQAPATAQAEPTTEVTAPVAATATATSRPDAAATDEPQATAPLLTEAAESGTVSDTASGTAPDAESNTTPDSNATPVIFEIVQADSEVRFIIEEVLNGAPKTVIGVTDQVAGEIAIFVDDPAQTKIGTILVNARTLTTDNEFRNRAIKNRILYTDDYEFITFTPTGIIGMPDGVTIGESLSFQIVGALTVRDVTNEVTFDAVVTPISETQLEGNASTTILYPDFDLTIPEAPSVAGVEDEVKLEIAFVAVAK